MTYSGSSPSRARLGVDIGGTFTDFILDLDGTLHSHKVLTTGDQPERAVLAGIQALLQRLGLRGGQIDMVVHGTTLATNAVIERKGARTAFLTTEGFRDVLEMGHESRCDHYDLMVDKPAPLIPRSLRLTVTERMSARGTVLRELDRTQLEEIAATLAHRQIESLAIGFLHSYANPAHEQAARDFLRQRLPGLRISISSEVSPEIREYERFSTTAVNAFVQPLMASYLDRLVQGLRAAGIGAPLLLMLSNGGVCDVPTAQAFPVRLLESGPAGGAIFAARVAQELQIDKVLSLDIGGTTAKLCFIDDGRPLSSRALEVARLYRFKPGSGIPLRIPVIELSEIGAGGGSIASVDKLRRVRVGPESAGSFPGPACYGRGGSDPTITDAHLLAGRLDPEYFAAGSIRLDRTRSAAVVAAKVAGPLQLEESDAAYAICEMADEAMASAARAHAIECGKAISGRTLIAFGGSAPLHAARMADKLGIDRVVIPAFAGVGSALGFLDAPVAYEITRSLHQILAAMNTPAVNGLFAEMRAQAIAVLGAHAASAIREERHAFMRYRGQGHELRVTLPEGAGTDAHALRAAFDAAYAQIYGRLIADADVEVASWSLRMEVTGHAAERRMNNTAAGSGTQAPRGERALFDQTSAAWTTARQYFKRTLAPGALIEAPALVVDEETTIVVTRPFVAYLSEHGHLIMERRSQTTEKQA
jgi:N-methylhydantoinase A/oxoprolinase/acetone carboxylase beta subunit